VNAKEESMTRFGSLVLCVTLGVGLFACGNGSTPADSPDSSPPTPKDPLELVPLDNTVSNWLVDQSSSKTPGARAMTAATLKEAVGLIDGGAEPFYLAPFAPKLFLWQNYINTTLPKAPDGAHVSLRILQMPSKDQAQQLYTALLQQSDYARKAGTSDDWQATSPPMGAESRIQDTTSQWWINFHDDVFYVEVLLDPSTGPAPEYTPGDTDLKQETIRFAQVVADSI
jgi:hypothetical protein